MRNPQFEKHLTQISLQQLLVLVESEVLEIQKINPEEIHSPQSLIIYFIQNNPQYELIKQKNNRNRSSNSSQIQLLTIQLLNEQFQQKNIDENKNSVDNNEQKQKQQNLDQVNLNHNTSQIFLLPQILQIIQTYFPKSFNLINSQKINQFSYIHCTKILLLIQITLKDRKDLQIKQLNLVMEKFILPIIFYHPKLIFECIEILKRLMKYCSENQKLNRKIRQDYSVIVTKFFIDKYQRSLTQQNTTHSNTINIQNISAIMSAIQTIHNQFDNYNLQLVSSKAFSTYILKMLMCSSAQSKTANAIAINIYGTLLKQLNLYNRQSQLFITLYTTLKCFGAHLVKDIWPLFYDIIQFPQTKSIFTKAQLIDVLFYKLQHHQNINVVKHCIQSLLQQQRSFILFRTVPDAIYQSLIRILNFGMHYLDCLFHMDSKMYIMIGKFFSKFFNTYHEISNEKCQGSKKKNNQNVENYIVLFVKAILQRVSFDHALVSMMNSFVLVTIKSKSVNLEVLQCIMSIIKKYYLKYPIRKRHQLMNGVCYLLKNHLKVQSMPSQGHFNEQNQNQAVNLKDEVNKKQRGISLQILMKTCIIQLPKQFIQLIYNGEQKKQLVTRVILQNYTKQDVNNCIKLFIEQVNQILRDTSKDKNQNKIVVQNLKAIQLLLFLIEKQNSLQTDTHLNQLLKQETIDHLKFFYSYINEKYIIQIGQNLYATTQQRILSIQIQQELFDKFWLIKRYSTQLKLQILVQKVLTNVSLLIKSFIQIKSNIKQNEFQTNIMQFLVKKIFQIIYDDNYNVDEEVKQKLCRYGSQFLEWATDNIESQYCVLMIIRALKTSTIQRKTKQIDYIQQSVYDIFWSTFSEQHKKYNVRQRCFVQKVKNILPTYKLRLYVLSSSILFNDQSQLIKFSRFIVEDIEQIADRYDYQNLDEIFYLIQIIYTCKSQHLRKNNVGGIFNKQRFIRETILPRKRNFQHHIICHNFQIQQMLRLKQYRNIQPITANIEDNIQQPRLTELQTNIETHLFCNPQHALDTKLRYRHEVGNFVQ